MLKTLKGCDFVRYRKKPIVIEAFQAWVGKMAISDTPEWFQKAIKEGVVDSVDMTIQTLEGVHLISDGDYVIQGVQGELYPCKPDIFEQTYEPAE
jgi:hypothetical protein